MIVIIIIMRFDGPIDLHERFFGRQDDYISQRSFDSLVGILIETRTILVDWNQLNDQPIVSCVKFSNSVDAQHNYGYTNLHFDGDFKHMEYIELILGGQRFDCIYPKFVGKLLTFDMMDKNIIPAVRCHDFRISAQHSGCFKIIYDVFQITDPKKKNDFYEILVNLNQFNGYQTIDKQSKIVRLDFNHPITKINLISDHPISSVVIDLCGHFLKFNSIDQKTYEYTFDKSVNFSGIDNAIIKCEAQNQTQIAVFAQSLNIVKINNDMIGLMFSK